MRVAIVHDWFSVYGGAERVVREMLKCFPGADVYSVIDFLSKEDRSAIGVNTITTSFIQKLPFAKSKYRTYLPLMPLAVESFDLSAYDVVISSSSAVAKGVLTGPDQLHICMCYSPMRYAWDLTHQYLRESGLTSGLKSWIARALLSYMRIWDFRTGAGVDEFIAISHFIQRRIKKVYGRTSRVIYPPVDVDQFSIGTTREDFYLTASRMVPYKKIDLIVESFSAMPDKKLIVIGDGPDFEKIRAKAGANVELLGYQPYEVLQDHFRRARAFVFAAEEDFGIAPLEAQACGTPVIAFGRGAVLETIHDKRVRPAGTGVYFEEQTVASIQSAVRRFESLSFTPEACRANAMRFAPDRFRLEFSGFVKAAWDKFLADRVVQS
jgi:glycosyltransferase involved in cell wall biosynthesis